MPSVLGDTAPPSRQPTKEPTNKPTPGPTVQDGEPTVAPTKKPTPSPSFRPTSHALEPLANVCALIFRDIILPYHVKLGI